MDASNTWDAIAIGVILICVGLSWGLVRLCDRLR